MNAGIVRRRIRNADRLTNANLNFTGRHYFTRSPKLKEFLRASYTSSGLNFLKSALTCSETLNFNSTLFYGSPFYNLLYSLSDIIIYCCCKLRPRKMFRMGDLLFKTTFFNLADLPRSNLWPNYPSILPSWMALYRFSKC